MVLRLNFWCHWLRIWAYNLKRANGKFNMADQNANNYWIWMICLVLFLTMLAIFNDESVNSTFRNKKWPVQNGWPKIKFKYKLRWNSVHAHTAQIIAETCQKYFQSFIATRILSQHFYQILKNILSQHYNVNFLKYFWKQINI